MSPHSIFIKSICTILKKKKTICVVDTDCVNHLIYEKRKKLDPTFIIPTVHLNKLTAPVADNENSISDSENPDNDLLSIEERRIWTDQIKTHLTIILRSLNPVDQNRWKRKFVLLLLLTRRERLKLHIAIHSKKPTAS